MLDFISGIFINNNLKIIILIKLCNNSEYLLDNKSK